MPKKDLPKNELIRINRDLFTKLRKAVDDYDFTVRDLVQWILSDVDLDVYAKKLAANIESEVEGEEETARADEQEAEDEETSTDEERAESADDETENFGEY